MRDYKQAKLTFSFSNKITAETTTAYADEEKAWDNRASIAGFYFEACVYQALVKISGSRTRREYTGQQKAAIYAFQNHKRLNKLKNQIERAASATAQEWYNNFKKELENKNITISTIADIRGDDGIVRGNPLGDIRIQAGDKVIILELKWQMSNRPMVHWFSLTDQSLFNGEFLNFVRDKNPTTYWSYEIEDSAWKSLISNQALGEFLDNGGEWSASEEALVKFLIQKGRALDQLPNANYDAKYVVHGTGAEVTITNIDTIQEELSSDLSNKNRRTRINKYSKQNEFIWKLGQSNIATFGISKFSYPRGTKKEDKGRYTSFTFDMYFSQKYANFLRKR